MDRLDCTVMPYAWGSRRAIADLLGRPSPSPGPEAELWMGAHPIAPSMVDRDGARSSLLERVAADPLRELGRDVQSAFGRLPFLMKVLAADAPLSLQAHPDAARARQGFEEEERAGVSMASATRNYKDPFHKPELICALTPFRALSGFRRATETAALFDALAIAELRQPLAPLRDAPNAAGLAATFRAIMSLPAPLAAAAARATLGAATAHAGPFLRECDVARTIAALYPEDRGVIVALLLNVVDLAPGEAIYLGPGNLHAYLGGVGVEIMASSDNVLRGGLTPKHVDVPELLRVLDFVDGPIAPVGTTAPDRFERIFVTPAREFQLSVLTLDGTAVERRASGPEIHLVTEGAATLVGADGSRLSLERGSACFVPASTDHYRVLGEGRIFRATVGAL